MRDSLAENRTSQITGPLVGGLITLLLLVVLLTLLFVFLRKKNQQKRYENTNTEAMNAISEANEMNTDNENTNTEAMNVQSEANEMNTYYAEESLTES